MIIIFPTPSVGGIEAGASKLDITPQAGLSMYGYGARKGVSTGVLDQLYVRVLVLRSDERSIAIIHYDLGQTFAENVLSELRQKITDQMGINETIFIATHSHSAAVIQEESELQKIICNKTITAVEKAYDSLKPALIGTGWGEVDLNYNRRRVFPDGSVRMMFQNRDKIPAGPVDKTVGIIKIDDLNGNTIAVLVNYACHPVVYAPDNYKYSADFPGVMSREVQKSLKGEPICFFIQGACGDMNPYYAMWPIDDGAQSKVEEMGKELAHEVIRVAKDIESKQYADKLSLLSEIKHFPIVARWDMEKLISLVKDEKYKKYIQNTMNRGKGLNVPLTVILITPEIGWIGFPGEFFVEFQKEIRSKSPVNFLFVSGYTNGMYAYFPTINAAAEGGYGANDGATFVAVGTGERLVIEAIVSLYELLGRLKPFPAGYERLIK